MADEPIFPSFDKEKASRIAEDQQQKELEAAAERQRQKEKEAAELAEKQRQKELEAAAEEQRKQQKAKEEKEAAEAAEKERRAALKERARQQVEENIRIRREYYLSIQMEQAAKDAEARKKDEELEDAERIKEVIKSEKPQLEARVSIRRVADTGEPGNHYFLTRTEGKGLHKKS